MPDTVNTTGVDDSIPVPQTAPSTATAENTDPVTQGPRSSPATVAGTGVGPRGRKAAAAGHGDRAGTSTAGANSAAGRPRAVGTVTPEAATAAAEGPERGDVAGARDAGSVSARVWAVLLTRPGVTAVELAAAAHVGRSTVSKLLARWASEGAATSTTGATTRAARRWTVTPDTTTDTTPVAPRSQAEGVGPVDAHENTGPSATEADSPAYGQAPQLADAGTTDDAQSTRPPTDTATRGNRRGSVASAAPETDTTPGSPADTRADAGAATGSPGTRPRMPRSHYRSSSRLAAGQLRGMVEEYLAEHPGPHGPVEIGHALRRSSGAIANALERLVETGWAERNSERPKRYRFADADDLTSDDPGDSEDPEGVDGGALTDRVEDDADDGVARLDRQTAEPQS